MESNRRSFIRMVGAVVAWLIAGTRRALAAPSASVPRIHEQTRNTPFGAMGRRRPSRRPGPPHKPYPGMEVVALPRPATGGRSLAQVVRAALKPQPFAPQVLSLEELATLLHDSNGITDDAPPATARVRRRAAPSAGAQYAGEVYVVVERVEGLAPGVYSFSVRDHSLRRLSSGSSLERVVEAIEVPVAVGDAAFAVLLSNVFGRYSWRYANRAYRYALIDSGHIGENLRLAAHSRGLVEACALRFHDDALNELLELDGRHEAVCAVHLVGRAGNAESSDTAGTRRDWVELQQRGELAGRGPVTERYHEATKLVPAQGAKIPADPGSRASEAEIDGARVALPRGEGGAMTTSASIRIRRSAREFEAKPLSTAELGFVLAAAQGNPSLERAPGVVLDVVVHEVSGIPAGVYRYDPKAHALIEVRKGALRAPMVRACLRQAMAGSAAVGLVMSTRLDAMRSPLGDRRYRDLLFEAGAIGQRIYLAAESIRLAARNLAAFEDDRFNELLWLDRRGEHALHLTMLGHGD